MQFERLSVSGQLKLILSDALARKVVYNDSDVLWHFNPYYNAKFIQLFQKAYGIEFRVHADFYSVNMNVLLFFFCMGGKYYIQLSTENHETDDEYFVAALLESLVKN
jgi:hypothetical protein